SLVRPDRISSPMTSIAAVTISPMTVPSPGRSGRNSQSPVPLQAPRIATTRLGRPRSLAYGGKPVTRPPPAGDRRAWRKRKTQQTSTGVPSGKPGVQNRSKSGNANGPCRSHANPEPSPSRGRCRDWTGGAYSRKGQGEGTVQTTNALGARTIVGARSPQDG